MRDNPEEYPEEHIDEETAATMILAAEIIVRLKRLGKAELELPMIDENCVWIMTVKRIGIADEGEF